LGAGVASAGAGLAGAAATGAADGSVVVVWAAQPVTATAAANTTAVMILAGRMATSL
jgi:hypothetical protein